MAVITSDIKGDKEFLIVFGRITSTTYLEFEKYALEIPDYVKDIEIDAEKMDYISSSGLRVLMLMSKNLAKKGGSVFIKNVTPEVLEVIEMTGMDHVVKII